MEDKEKLSEYLTKKTYYNLNLYKVIFSYHAPRGSCEGIKALVIAENNEQVYNWIASEPIINVGYMFNSWKEYEKYTWSEQHDMFIDQEGFEVDDSWYDENGDPENFKDRMLRLKGEVNDDSIDFSDTYYGKQLLGWELVKEDITTDYSELIELGIVFKLV